MEQKHFHIKNMVCEHCAQVLEEQLEEKGFAVKHIELGKLELMEPVAHKNMDKLISVVRENGFDIIGDKGSRIVEEIKHLIIDIIHNKRSLNTNLSNYLAEQLHKDYQYLSRLFTSVEGKSIERYYILQKIERAKELIVYGEQNLTEIAYELGYSSQQHFSRQFKKETGLSPSHFKKVKENKRISADEI